MAINNCTIMGRITAPLEIRNAGEHKVLSFTVAVDRNFTDADGDRQADFIRCVAWNKTAEFITQYFGKGSMIALTGWLQTGSYDDENGTTHFTTDLVVQQVSFTGEKKTDEQPAKQGKSQPKGKKKTSSYSQGYPF